MILILPCQHCGNKTLLISDLKTTEVLCAFGDCHKVSPVDESAKRTAYIEYLESELTRMQEVMKSKDLTLAGLKKQCLVKTHGGVRLVSPTFDSIQWAVKPT